MQPTASATRAQSSPHTWLVLSGALALGACGSVGDDAKTPGAATSDGYLEGAGAVELYYRVLGSGADSAVVVHGGPGAGMQAILPHLEPLADRHTLIFYDQRGGGRSTLPSDTSLLDARYFIADLEAVRRHFGLWRMQIIAHSFGAILAAAYADRYPDRIARMVFLGATGPRHAPAAAAARRRQQAGDSAKVARLRAVIRELLSGTAEDPVAACREYEALQGAIAGDTTVSWKGTTCAGPPQAVRYYYRYTARLTPASFAPWDFTTRLGDVRAPLLVITGDGDPDGMEVQRAWADALPNGRLLVVPDARIPVAQRPEIVYAAIDRFLRDH